MLPPTGPGGLVLLQIKSRVGPMNDTLIRHVAIIALALIGAAAWIGTLIAMHNRVQPPSYDPDGVLDRSISRVRDRVLMLVLVFPPVFGYFAITDNW